jgi:hypothetical protein
MEIPMRVYGLTLAELFLAGYLSILGWCCCCLRSSAPFSPVFGIVGFGAGWSSATLATGLVLSWPAADRQNHASRI